MASTSKDSANRDIKITLGPKQTQCIRFKVSEAQQNQYLCHILEVNSEKGMIPFMRTESYVVCTISTRSGDPGEAGIVDDSNLTTKKFEGVFKGKIVIAAAYPKLSEIKGRPVWLTVSIHNPLTYMSTRIEYNSSAISSDGECTKHEVKIWLDHINKGELMNEFEKILRQLEELKPNERLDLVSYVEKGGTQNLARMQKVTNFTKDDYDKVLRQTRVQKNIKELQNFKTAGEVGGSLIAGAAPLALNFVAPGLGLLALGAAAAVGGVGGFLAGGHIGERIGVNVGPTYDGNQRFISLVATGLIAPVTIPLAAIGCTMSLSYSFQAVLVVLEKLTNDQMLFLWKKIRVRINQLIDKVESEQEVIKFIARLFQKFNMKYDVKFLTVFVNVCMILLQGSSSTKNE